MATNWETLTLEDLAGVIGADVIAKANANIDEDSVQAKMQNPDGPATYDPELADRATYQLDMAVKQFRAAIRSAGKTGLSLTANTLPPEGKRHALYIAAFGLINSIPNLQMVLLNEGGVYAPIADMAKKANEFLELVYKGRPVTPADDPTGRDYINAINVPWFSNCPSPYPAYDATKAINPPVGGVRFGANSRPTDLRTYDAIFQAPAPCWFPVDDIGQP